MKSNTNILKSNSKIFESQHVDNLLKYDQFECYKSARISLDQEFTVI